ncbi:phosphate transport system permease protein PstA [Christensenellaceae bacterium]|nr:phosphate transport system permease protein PstA [Christensenellaceae bacterium]BDF61227.1 phosphate transport system permease protein PstA [Christensenellaceae bacterium]
MGNSLDKLSNDISLMKKKSRPKDGAQIFAIYACAILTVAILFYLLIYIMIRGLPQVNWSFLSTAPSALNKTVGILPSILNTLYMIGITLLIATPIGVGAAIYLNEYAKRGKIVRVIEFTTETLAGIPSVLYGLFGAVFFGVTLQLGYSILAGALTLVLMILPVIVRTTQEAIKTVPDEYREGALGIGTTKWHMIRTIILPGAVPGIITAIILAIGRIVGESAALLFTSGIGTNMPNHFFGHVMESGATLTVQLYTYAAKGQNDAAFGIAAVLVVIVLTINLLTNYLSKRFSSRNK